MVIAGDDGIGTCGNGAGNNVIVIGDALDHARDDLRIDAHVSAA